METNAIRNYNEVTENGIKPSKKYVEKQLQLRTDEDKDACLRFLTINNNSMALCHGFYSAEYMNSVIQISDYLLYFHDKNDSAELVAFALLQLKSRKKRKIIDILLLCAIPNKQKFGNMMAHSVYNFAVTRRYPFLYVSPRTPELRKTFVKYGFENLRGVEGFDEVLEKEIEFDIPVIPKRNKTQKVKRTN